MHSEDHPRSRGEYEFVGWGSPAITWIIPALAGNTFPLIRNSTSGKDHPRSRGEYSKLLRMHHDHPGSSPLSRGIPSEEEIALFIERIIPALAGNTSQRNPGRMHSEDHPRSRGEYEFVGWGSPAITWIIPALAGNTFPLIRNSTSGKDHPRSRGEYSKLLRMHHDHPGSSPLSRGIPPVHVPMFLPIGIIPALAGNTP